MSLPIITPAEDQPLWALMKELEDLGGIRHQDFKAVAGSPRWGYQVTPELYQKWLEAGGVDTSGEHSDPSTDGAEATGDGQGTQDQDDATGGTADGQDADTQDAPAQGDDKATTKAAVTKRAPRVK